MLKTRIIGVVLVKNGIVVQSIGFKKYLPIGSPEIAINYLDRWGVDEITVLHINASLDDPPPTEEQIKSYATQCQVPLSIGGGIKEIDDIKKIIRSGADKVVINSSLISRPEIISEGCDLFGQQSMVVSIDGTRQETGALMAFTHGVKPIHASIIDLAHRAVKLGAGELLINSIDRDGSKKGFDLELIRSVAGNIHIPVIACGGAGHPNHLKLAIESGASVVAVGNLFHFTEHSVTVIKQYLNTMSAAVRLDSDFNYENFEFDKDGRPARRHDSILDALRFQFIPEEVI